MNKQNVDETSNLWKAAERDVGADSKKRLALCWKCPCGKQTKTNSKWPQSGPYDLR
ncbi:MAG: hypothetical protein K2P07_04575 [Lachnospiraceae bacterium]|nr:hypothetical protein [Lachnospiraceae bacterium]MDE7007421.1 hypothetical protein [Lachnospiraceae bacterium]